MGFATHWGIENRLHWVKDVIFGEDAAPLSNYNAATNWSIIRNITINLAPMRWLRFSDQGGTISCP